MVHLQFKCLTFDHLKVVTVAFCIFTVQEKNTETKRHQFLILMYSGLPREKFLIGQYGFLQRCVSRGIPMRPGFFSSSALTFVKEIKPKSLLGTIQVRLCRGAHSNGTTLLTSFEHTYFLIYQLALELFFIACHNKCFFTDEMILTLISIINCRNQTLHSFHQILKINMPQWIICTDNIKETWNH